MLSCNVELKRQTPNQIPVEIRNALKELRLHKFYPKVLYLRPRTCDLLQPAAVTCDV